MNKVYLLIGGNIGNRLENLEKAEQLIAMKAGTVVKKSSLYETAAWGNENQPSFLNQILVIDTELLPIPLLKLLLEIEERLGRKRAVKYDPRLIDIDILFYGDVVLDEETLKIPHPALQSRRFVLTPLVEISADYVHPILKKTVQQLLNECPDQLEVKKLDDKKIY